METVITQQGSVFEVKVKREIGILNTIRTLGDISQDWLIVDKMLISRTNLDPRTKKLSEEKNELQLMIREEMIHFEGDTVKTIEGIGLLYKKPKKPRNVYFLV